MAKLENPKKKLKKNGYKMPEPLPNGLILEDILKQKWQLGTSIGKGGFGEIYLAKKLSEKGNYSYVIKIEPHENGPLFVEMHFYMKAAKQNDVESFKKANNLKSFGMPIFIASGSHDYNNIKYRFLVMQKFGTDLYKVFLENNRRFPTATVFKVGIQILKVLEYMHFMKYIHADIKGANILLGNGHENNTQVYLVDFGLAAHYDVKYKPDPKKAHNGTIEYLSRDAHQGVQSRRGDLEILGYNLTQWLGCTLPWEGNSKEVEVQKMKETNMENLPQYFKTCFKDSTPPAALCKYFDYVINLKFEDDPKYDKLLNILEEGVKAAGDTVKSPLVFESGTSPKRKTSPIKVKTPKKIKQETNNFKINKENKKKLIEPLSNIGDTPEMKRIRELKAIKKQSGSSKAKAHTGPTRSLRNRNPVCYNEAVLAKNTHSPNSSVDIVSDSEDDS